MFTSQSSKRVFLFSIDRGPRSLDVVANDRVVGRLLHFQKLEPHHAMMQLVKSIEQDSIESVGMSLPYASDTTERLTVNASRHHGKTLYGVP